MAISPSVERFLKSNGVDYRVVQHPLAFTAQEDAALAHVPGREWAKTVVCLADGEPIQAVLPAHLAIDVERLRALAGVHSLRLAEESEFETLYPGCARGAMPPLGPLFGQRVFVDVLLTADTEITFNAGTHTDAIRMRYDAFAELAHPVIGDFAQRPASRAAARGAGRG
jgi:Ala-tRNA(Pro) deacylase